MVYFTTRSNNALNPFKHWDNIAEQLDSVFTDLERKAETIVKTPATDIEETESYFDLSFDMPGVSRDELSVELKDRTLTVTGKRVPNQKPLELNSKFHRTESFRGDYKRTITLPETIKSDAIEASYDNGVLHVRVPKTQPAGAKKIAIGFGPKASETTEDPKL